MIETNFDYHWKDAAETLRKALALGPQDPTFLWRREILRWLEENYTTVS